MQKNPFSSLTEAAYFALRVVAGLMFAFHGLQKLTGAFHGFQPPAGGQLWIGGVIELSTGILIAIGLLTPYAALLASGTMAVAYIQFHWKGKVDSRFFPSINKGELALLYCFLFLFVAGRGSGKMSVDAARG